MSTARAQTWTAAGSERLSADAAFERLVDAHYRRIFTLAHRMVGNEADAADLTQEAFVRVYRALPRLRAEEAAGGWVRRIATNLCLDHLRRRRTQPPPASLDARCREDTGTLAAWDIADPSGEPERLFWNRHSAEVLRRAVSSLPDDYRVVVVLHHMEEMRVEEIACLCGVPAGTIKSRLSRARRELRRKLLPYFDR